MAHNFGDRGIRHALSGQQRNAGVAQVRKAAATEVRDGKRLAELAQDVAVDQRRTDARRKRCANSKDAIKLDEIRPAVCIRRISFTPELRK